MCIHKLRSGFAVLFVVVGVVCCLFVCACVCMLRLKETEANSLNLFFYCFELFLIHQKFVIVYTFVNF